MRASIRTFVLAPENTFVIEDCHFDWPTKPSNCTRVSPLTPVVVRTASSPPKPCPPCGSTAFEKRDVQLKDRLPPSAVGFVIALYTALAMSIVIVSGEAHEPADAQRWSVTVLARVVMRRDSSFA